MKYHRSIALLLFATALLAGCADTEKIITRKDGRWEITSSTYELYTNGTLDSGEFEVARFVTFNSDGTARYEDPDDSSFDSRNVSWDYFAETNQVLITESYQDSSFSVTTAILWDVLESNKNSMSWYSTQDDGSLRQDLRWELRRAD